MKIRVLSFLAISFIAVQSQANICADMVTDPTLVVRNLELSKDGRFVPLRRAPKEILEIQKQFAPEATSFMLLEHSPVIVFKTTKELGRGYVSEVAEIFNTVESSVTHRIVAGTEINSVRMSSNRNFAYVEQTDGRIGVYSRNGYVNSLPQFWRAKGMAMSADGKRLFVFSESYREFISIDTLYLEAGHSLPRFPGDRTQGSEILPFSSDLELKPSRKATIEPSSDGKYIILAADTGTVVVLESRGQGILSVAYRDLSRNLRKYEFFSYREHWPSTVVWTGPKSFAVIVNGQLERFSF